MKYPTLRFVFDRKHVATEKKKGLVQIEVTSEGMRKWIGTKVKVYYDQWDDRKKVIRSSDSIQLNSKLDAQMNQINEFIIELMKKSLPFDFEKLESFLQNTTHSISYIDFIRSRIEQRNDVEESTKKQHRTLLKSLIEFGKTNYVSDLTKQNIIQYDDYLHKLSISQTTIHNYHKRNKRYIHEAMNFDLLKDDPYSGLSFERGKFEKRKYLTEDELQKLGNCKINNLSSDRIRDLFLFQCYTGFSYSDLSQFDFKNDVEQRNNKFVIADRRIKTNEDYYIVLLSPAIRILEKYDFVLPVITNQKYNLVLKVVAQYADINKNLTTHCARHTFAVFALNNGVSIEIVAKMLGHTNIRTTQIYAKVLNKEVEKGFDLLESKLK